MSDTEHPKAKPLGIEMMVATLALAISLCALGVSVYEANILSAQQKASVWPYVEVGPGYSADGFRVDVVNQGIGPALIEGVSVSLDGDAMATWDDLIAAVLGPENTVNYSIYRTSAVSGRVLPPGTTLNAFNVPWTEDTRKLVDGLDKLDFVLCYCSVFEDCWVTGNNKKPTPGRCPIPEERRFRN